MDYETMCNAFIAVFIDYEDENNKKIFIISDYQNDYVEFIEFLEDCIKTKSFHFSFNGIAFDAQITQYVLENKFYLSQNKPLDIAKLIYKQAQKTISKSNNNEFLDYPEWKLSINQLDIFKLLHWNNVNKRTSLKWAQYSMDWYNIEEMPIHHATEIFTKEEYDLIIEYCINDVLSTKKLIELSKEQIDLRISLTKDYKLNLLSASETKITKDLFMEFLSKKTGIDKKDLKKGRTNRGSIDIKEVIFPYIEFKTPEFNNVLNYFKSCIITSTKSSIDYKLNYNGHMLSYGQGGIHSSIKKGNIIESSSEYMIIDSDFSSYYPNLCINNKLAPAHLPQKEFNELYKFLYEERKKIPKSNPKNGVYKLMLNGLFGLTMEDNSPFKDWLVGMTITVNGQLILSMFIEKVTLSIPEAFIIQANTDGVTFYIPRNKYNNYIKIASEIEKLTALEFEHVEYKKFLMRDVNSYISITTNDKVKSKGAFEWEDLDKKKVATFHKNKSFLVIPKAIYEYFINGIKPEDYLDQNDNIFDYCGAVKAKGSWHFETRKIVHQVPDKYLYMSTREQVDYLNNNGWRQSWGPDNWVRKDSPNQEANNGVPTEVAFKSAIRQESVVESKRLQKIIRYYISNSGERVVKCNDDGREIQVEAGKWKQTVCNKISKELKVKDMNIDYNYYLQAIYKEIHSIDEKITRGYKQLDLF